MMAAVGLHCTQDLQNKQKELDYGCNKKIYSKKKRYLVPFISIAKVALQTEECSMT